MVVTRRQAAQQQSQQPDAKEPGTGNGPVTNGVSSSAAAAAYDVDEDGHVVAANWKAVKHEPTPFWVYVVLLVFAIVTVVTRPEPFHPPHGTEPTIQHVFFYGWLTAISTGLGVVPFVFLPRVATYWVGISNGE